VSSFFAADEFTALLLVADVDADRRGPRHERPIPTRAIGVRESATDGTAPLRAHFTQPRLETVVTTLAIASIFVAVGGTHKRVTTQMVQ
jgi:4-hydroxybenzoate polyprenyltransferase